MSKAQLLAIAIRVVAIYLFINSANIAVLTIPLSSQMATGTDEDMAALYLLVIAFLLLPLLLLWWSLPIARKLVPGNGDEPLQWQVSLDGIHVVAISILGLFVLTQAIPELLRWLYIYYQMKSNSPLSELSPQQTASVLAHMAQLLIGVGLVLGANGLRGWLMQVRNLGNKSK